MYLEQWTAMHLSMQAAAMHMHGFLSPYACKSKCKSRLSGACYQLCSGFNTNMHDQKYWLCRRRVQWHVACVHPNMWHTMDECSAAGQLLRATGALKLQLSKQCPSTDISQDCVSVNTAHPLSSPLRLQSLLLGVCFRREVPISVHEAQALKPSGRPRPK